MPLNLQIDPGGEKFLPFAKKKLAQMKADIVRAGVRALSRWIHGENIRIWINSVTLSHGVSLDWIKIAVLEDRRYIHVGPGGLVVGSIGGPYTGLADHTVGLYSVWAEGGGDSFVTEFLTFSSATTFGVQLRKDLVTIRAWNGIGNPLSPGENPATWSVVATGPITWSAGWHHLLLSYALPTGFTVYFDNAPVTMTPIASGTGEPFSARNTVDGISHLFSAEDSCTGELYWAPGQLINIALEENRAKFGLTKPGFGGDGSAPTGLQPVLYSPLFSGAKASVNKGTGEDWGLILFGPCATAL